MITFDTRSSELEILDQEGVSADAIEASLRFMVWVNKYLGGYKLILDYLNKCRLPQSFTVLDLGSGSGDIPYAVLNWAKSRGLEPRITALDINPHCLAFARRHYTSPGLEYVHHSAFDMESLGKFDVVISSMFFHHLSDHQAAELLKKMWAQSRIGFIVNDLYRSLWPYLGAAALSLFWRRRIVFNDAKLSVKRAFRESDFERLKQLSGLPDLKIARKPVWRLTLTK